MRLIVAVHSADELGGDPDHRTRLLSRPLVGWLLLQRYEEPITEHIDDCPILRAPVALRRPPGLPRQVESVTRQQELAEDGGPSRRRPTGDCGRRENWKPKNEMKDSGRRRAHGVRFSGVRLVEGEGDGHVDLHELALPPRWHGRRSGKSYPHVPSDVEGRDSTRTAQESSTAESGPGTGPAPTLSRAPVR